MTTTPPENRRTRSDRRQDDAQAAKERRSKRLGRRMTDKQSERIHTLFLVVLGGIILMQLTLAIIGGLN